jgi:dihydrofolate reductase
VSAEPSTITLVAAVARNGVIGSDGGLPWHLPADLKHFKAVTLGHPMIMGRRTFESIGRVLPGRRTIVVTRDPAWSAPPGVTVARSVDEAIEVAATGPEPETGDRAIMVVGGGEIYRQTLHRADRLEITHVEADVAGDTSFPTIDPALWRVSSREDADGYAFVSYVRRAAIHDLPVLLASMRPELHDGVFLYCTLPAGIPIPDGCHPVVTVAESEGTTLVVPVAEAESAGLAGTFPCSWVTLTVPSALAAVGLTAAVATALAKDGISCNVVAGFHHDHLFVPVADAAAAVAALQALAHTRS